MIFMEAKNFFISHDISYPLLWGFDFSLPIILKTALNIDGVDISDEDKKTLRSLNKERLLYFSNHPTTIEPPVAYYVSNVIGSRFYYMASRNVFNWGFGLVGELIKRVGAFSVLSGGADRESVKMAKSVLAGDNGKLVIYPEGMCSGENDNLVPFMPGIAQIGFWGLEDAKKKDPKADVKVLPAFVKYTLTGTAYSLYREIETSIEKIEHELEINSSNKNLLRRFLTVGRVLLENVEREYGISYVEDKDYNFRVGRVRHEALNRAGKILKIEFQENEDAIHKIREVFTVLDGINSGLSTKGPKLTNKELAEAQKETDRAYLFLVIKPEYLLSYPSAERFMEWLHRFENLVFGKTNPRARRARVVIARPFGLDEYYHEYKKDKKRTVEEVTNRLRKDIESLLTDSISLTKPIVTPFEVGDDFKH
jgi:hypothetical protein